MMGPEAALLSQRLGRFPRDEQSRGAYERAKGSVYVEVAVRSKLDEFLGPGHSAPAPGVWARMRAAWRAPAARTAPGTRSEQRDARGGPFGEASLGVRGVAGSIAAAPIAVKADSKNDRRARYGEADLTLASLPLYRRPQE